MSSGLNPDNATFLDLLPLNPVGFDWLSKSSLTPSSSWNFRNTRSPQSLKTPRTSSSLRHSGVISGQSLSLNYIFLVFVQ